MAAFSEQFSLREVIGNLAPGAIVLSSIIYVVSKTSYYQELIAGESSKGSLLSNDWIVLLVMFVISFGIGMLLTSLTETIFHTVTLLGAGARTSLGITAQEPESKIKRAFDLVARQVKRFVSHLSGGQDVTSSIREFRESWQEKAVEEGVVSKHAFELAANHYRTLFDAEPSGEESLLFCELYIRDRLPLAMLEIEQNAAKAALMGNLIMPILFWLIAIGIGLALAPFNTPSQQNQQSQEIPPIQLQLKHLIQQQQQEKQRLEQQQQQQLQQAQPWQVEGLKQQHQGQASNLELDQRQRREQLELQLQQKQEQSTVKSKSSTIIFLELFVFIMLLVIFPNIVRIIGRQWIKASRNYVRIIILSFTLACRLAPAGQGNKPATTKQ
jgi:hypothetical protein